MEVKKEVQEIKLSPSTVNTFMFKTMFNNQNIQNIKVTINNQLSLASAYTDATGSVVLQGNFDNTQYYDITIEDESGRY